MEILAIVYVIIGLIVFHINRADMPIQGEPIGKTILYSVCWPVWLVKKFIQ